MTLHPEARALMEHYAELGARGLDEMGVVEARQAVLAARRFSGKREDVALVRDLAVPGPAGRLPVRVYDPTPEQSRQVIVYLHGGGWIAGSIVTADSFCRMLARATRCTVASVEYRLAPETQFPGALEDAYAVVSAFADGSIQLGTERSQVVVAGDSAGGGLAAAVTLLLRDRRGPGVDAQILLYPALAPGPDCRSANPTEGLGYGLTCAEMDFFWKQYLPNPEVVEPYAAPLLAVDLAGLPRALVVTAEHDILAPEGTLYAQRLCEAGVNVSTVQAAGMVHGFFWQLGAVPVARRYLKDIAAFLET